MPNLGAVVTLFRYMIICDHTFVLKLSSKSTVTQQSSICLLEFLVAYLNFARIMSVVLLKMCLYFARIFTKMSPYEELVTQHCCVCFLMLLLALYCTNCAPTPFLYTLHSSQVMLWGLKRAVRLPCFCICLKFVCLSLFFLIYHHLFYSS